MLAFFACLLLLHLAPNRSICVRCAVRGSSAVCRRGYAARGDVTGARQATSLVFAATVFGTVCSTLGRKCACKPPRSLPAVVLLPARPGGGSGGARGRGCRNHLARLPPSSSMCCVKEKIKYRRLLGPPCRWRVRCHRGSVADVSVCVASEYFCPSQWRDCRPPNGKWTPVSGGGDWSDDGLSWGCVPVLLLLFVCLFLFSPTVSAVCLWLWVLWKGSLLACMSLQQWGHKEHLYTAKAAQTLCHQQRWPIGSIVCKLFFQHQNYHLVLWR